MCCMAGKPACTNVWLAGHRPTRMYAKNVHKYYHHIYIYVVISYPSRCFVALPLSPLQAMSGLDGEAEKAELEKLLEAQKEKVRLLEERIRIANKKVWAGPPPMPRAPACAPEPTALCVLMCVRIFCLLLCFDVPAIGTGYRSINLCRSPAAGHRLASSIK